MCATSLLLAGEFHHVPHNFLVKRRQATDGRWQDFGQVKITHEFITGLESGGGPRPRPGHESFLWIHFRGLTGIADPPACAERTEAVLKASNDQSGCRDSPTPKAKSVTVPVKCRFCSIGTKR